MNGDTMLVVSREEEKQALFSLHSGVCVSTLH